MQVTEVDLDVGCHGVALATRHFRAAIPCQGAIELLRSCQGRGFGVRALVRQLEQRHVPCLPLHEGCDLAVGIAEQKVALPMAQHCLVLHIGWALADEHGIDDPAMDGGLLCVVARTAHAPRTPQVLQKLFLQGTARLDKERAVSLSGV